MLLKTLFQCPRLTGTVLQEGCPFLTQRLPRTFKPYIQSPEI